MIFSWLKLALVFLAKLLICAPAKPSDPKIDPNAKCPSCGHRNGEIRAFDNKGTPLVQHHCKVCRANWYEKPVLNAKQLERLIRAQAE